MNPLEEFQPDPMLRVIGNHIRRLESDTRHDQLRGRILAHAAGLRFPGWWKPGETVARLGLGLGMAGIAATILAAFLLAPSAEARVESVVRKAAEHLRLPMERCYLAEVRQENDGVAEESLPNRTMKVVAADNEFRVEVTRGNFRWSWGRETDGTLWLTLGPHRGLRISKEEQGPGVMWMAELFSLSPKKLINQILAHCRLREDPRPGSSFPLVIHAEPRPGYRQTWLISADVELDPETKAVRKLTMRRTSKGGDGIVVVTFTLIESRLVDHAKFRLEGNLSEPFQIFDKDHHPDRRREMLTRRIGPQAEHWLKSSPAKYSQGD